MSGSKPRARFHSRTFDSITLSVSAWMLVMISPVRRDPVVTNSKGEGLAVAGNALVVAEAPTLPSGEYTLREALAEALVVEALV